MLTCSICGNNVDSRDVGATVGSQGSHWRVCVSCLPAVETVPGDRLGDWLEVVSPTVDGGAFSKDAMVVSQENDYDLSAAYEAICAERSIPLANALMASCEPPQQGRKFNLKWKYAKCGGGRWDNG